jgi:translation initiation factor 1A
VSPEISEGEEVIRFPLPNRHKGEMLAVATELHGAGHIQVVCEDGVSRMGRIRGKHRKRMWVREGDLLIVKPWDFQPEKADILYRYNPTQAGAMKRRGYIPSVLDVFEA